MDILIFLYASLSSEKCKKLLGALVTSIYQTLLELHMENDFQELLVMCKAHISFECNTVLIIENFVQA